MIWILLVVIVTIIIGIIINFIFTPSDPLEWSVIGVVLNGWITGICIGLILLCIFFINYIK